jgi:hypothetical protein
MNTDICYVVSHGFASRMLVQTDLLGRLVAQGKSVALVCPDANDPVLSGYCERHGIRLFEFRPKVRWMSDGYMMKRRYILEDIRENPALWEKHLAATKFHLARNPLKRFRPFWYYFMHLLARRFPAMRRRFAERERSRLRSPAAAELLERIGPARFVSTYPVNYAESILLNEANARPGTETWIHLLSWDNITCKGRFVATAERYIAWGEVMREELAEHYDVPADRIATCGVPHFDLHHGDAIRRAIPGTLAKLGLAAGRPVLLVAMSAPRFAPNEIDIVEWLAARVRDCDFGDVSLVLRPHPQNITGNLADVEWLPRLQRLAQLPGVAVSYPKLANSKLPYSMQQDDMEELAALLAASSVVVNSGSTVTIDALHHEKPVIITAFDGAERRDYWDSARRLVDYPHLKKLVGMGGARVASDYVQLEEMIRASITHPEEGAGERRFALERECHSLDGEATARVVEALCSPG